ncbi:hypothetical protein D7Z54_01710 [Salibacterium salarium]|uniref:Uncharacterized protein n=1 Tax=Salibacterium salarium TaxID=284579 RepID=A0A428NA88_9BACI|nr:hypothetical protein [Salibacterium salarium]RSL35307.1 hypothetical protein D7Z54_01710 [Salibacterium salarium]
MSDTVVKGSLLVDKTEDGKAFIVGIELIDTEGEPSKIYSLYLEDAESKRQSVAEALSLVAQDLSESVELLMVKSPNEAVYRHGDFSRKLKLNNDINLCIRRTNGMGSRLRRAKRLMLDAEQRGGSLICEL